MKYTIHELANSKGVSQPVREALLHMEAELMRMQGRELKLQMALNTPAAQPAVSEDWKWHQAPVKTSWGHDMVVADLAIDKDNTVSVYCEREQTTKVEAMFTPPAAKRQWVGLTDEEEDALIPAPDGSAEADVRRVEVLPGAWGKEYEEVDAWSKPLVLQMLRNHEAKLKEKNT
jgi:hypothetical protein